MLAKRIHFTVCLRSRSLGNHFGNRNRNKGLVHTLNGIITHVFSQQHRTNKTFCANSSFPSISFTLNQMRRAEEVMSAEHEAPWTLHLTKVADLRVSAKNKTKQGDPEWKEKIVHMELSFVVFRPRLIHSEDRVHRHQSSCFLRKNCSAEFHWSLGKRFDNSQ